MTGYVIAFSVNCESNRLRDVRLPLQVLPTSSDVLAYQQSYDFFDHGF